MVFTTYLLRRLEEWGSGRTPSCDLMVLYNAWNICREGGGGAASRNNTVHIEKYLGFFRRFLDEFEF
jgi:hypothetical protein